MYAGRENDSTITKALETAAADGEEIYCSAELNRRNLHILNESLLLDLATSQLSHMRINFQLNSNILLEIFSLVVRQNPPAPSQICFRSGIICAVETSRTQDREKLYAATSH